VTLHRCPGCEKTHVGDPAAPNRADATDLACAECDAEVLDLTGPGPAPRLKHGIPPGHAAARLRAVTGIGARCHTAATASGSTCITSAPRAAGGDHRPGNLACLCSVHHQMIHRGELFLRVDESRRAAPRLWFVLPTGETLGERRPEAPSVADVVERLRHDLEATPGISGRTLTRRIGSGSMDPGGADAGLHAVALDTLHALGHAVSRPDDTWYGADRVVVGAANAGTAGVDRRPIRPVSGRE
jgi:hypothetical protein